MISEDLIKENWPSAIEGSIKHPNLGDIRYWTGEERNTIVVRFSYEGQPKEESEKSYTSTTNDVELEISSIQGAYTMGGLTIALAMDDIENTGYVADKHEKETMMTFTFAF